MRPSEEIEKAVFGFVDNDVIDGSWKAEALKLLARAEQSRDPIMLERAAGLIKTAYDKMQTDIIEFLGIEVGERREEARGE